MSSQLGVALKTLQEPVAQDSPHPDRSSDAGTAGLGRTCSPKTPDSMDGACMALIHRHGAAVCPGCKRWMQQAGTKKQAQRRSFVQCTRYATCTLVCRTAHARKTCRGIFFRSCTATVVPQGSIINQKPHTLTCSTSCEGRFRMESWRRALVSRLQLAQRKPSISSAQHTCRSASTKVGPGTASAEYQQLCQEHAATQVSNKEY